jgi:RHS repeat-associated protein
MISNGNKGISTIKYNYLHLPDTIQFRNGNMVVNGYDATGMKRSVKHITSTGTILVPMGETRPLTTAQIRSVLTNDYSGPYEYENGTICKIFLPEGYAHDPASGGWKRIFNLKDHLGNNRVLLHDTEGVKQVNHYLPFGLPIGPLSTNRGFQQRKYNDKEFDPMYGLNWYDYGARYYDAVRNQFTTPDPLAEKKPWLSPYTFCSNNPISRIDPDGRNDYKLNQNGEIEFVKRTNAETHTIYAVNKNGGIDKKNSYNISKSVLSFSTQKVETVQNQPYTINTYTIFDKKQAKGFFKFVANNSKVEWSHTSATVSNNIRCECQL